MAENSRKTAAAKRQARDWSVYVIGPESGPFKVGIAISVSDRLKVLQTGSPARLVCHHRAELPGAQARAVEAAAHELLKAKRLTGEWFDCALSDAVAAVEAAVLAPKTKPRAQPRVRSLVRGIGPIHPGEILREEIIPAMAWTRSQIAEAAGISRQTLHDILGERQAITANTALRFGRLFGNSPEFWMRLQREHDLKVAELRDAEILATIEPLAWAERTSQ